MRAIILFFIVLLAPACWGQMRTVPANSASSMSALEIVRISPSGADVQQAAKQIVFQFNRAVVPLGRMARKAYEIPIHIQPRLPCQWRWLDPSALACELPPASQLALATRYEILIQPGIKDKLGMTIASTLNH